MRVTQDRVTAAAAARHGRPARVQPAHRRLDPAGLMALQRAVGNTATGAGPGADLGMTEVAQDEANWVVSRLK